MPAFAGMTSAGMTGAVPIDGESRMIAGGTHKRCGEATWQLR